MIYVKLRPPDLFPGRTAKLLKVEEQGEKHRFISNASKTAS